MLVMAARAAMKRFHLWIGRVHTPVIQFIMQRFIAKSDVKENYIIVMYVLCYVECAR